jgi:hypothetical protein
VRKVKVLFPTLSTSDVLGATAQFLFVLWPVVLAVPLLGRKGSLGGVVAVWFFLLATRIYLAFNPLPPSNLMSAFHIIPEPLNTYLFLVHVQTR